jgi:hypothetical protein
LELGHLSEEDLPYDFTEIFIEGVDFFNKKGMDLFHNKGDQDASFLILKAVDLLMLK